MFIVMSVARNMTLLYVSRWMAVFSLIALVFPFALGQALPGSGFSPLITLTLLPPLTVED